MATMTAKQFAIKYWQKNNPITTPMWKCMDAYHEYKLANPENAIEGNTRPPIDWEVKAIELGKLLLEARDALPAITEASIRLHNIDLTLADRIENALEIWRDDKNGI